MKKILVAFFIVVFVVLAIVLGKSTLSGSPGVDVSLSTALRQQTQISEIVSQQWTAMPTTTQILTNTITPEVLTPTTEVPVYDTFHTDTNLPVYQQPDFNSLLVYTLTAGSDVIWADSRHDFSIDPNWNWYHIQFTNPDKVDFLFDGYVALMTEQGKIETQNTCPVAVYDAMSALAAKTTNSNMFPGMTFNASYGFDSVVYLGITLGNIKTEQYNGMEIDSVQTVIMMIDPLTGNSKLYLYWQSLGVQTADRYLYNAVIGYNPEEVCALGQCGLDEYTLVSHDQWTRENILNRYRGNYFFSTIVYGDKTNLTFNGGSRWFNFDEIPQAWLDDHYDNGRAQALYSVFSQYEIANGGIINENFLQYQPVPDNWVNLGMMLTRYFSVSDGLNSLRYDANKTSVVQKCLQAIQ